MDEVTVMVIALKRTLVMARELPTGMVKIHRHMGMAQQGGPMVTGSRILWVTGMEMKMETKHGGWTR